jgi:hypothetical protein
MTLRRDLQLHWNARLNVLTILYTPPGTKALSDFISATKAMTAEWVCTRISTIPAARGQPHFTNDRLGHLAGESQGA